MPTTVKRITINLTKEQERQLKALCDYLGENQNQVTHRAIDNLWFALRLAIAATPDNPSQS